MKTKTIELYTYQELDQNAQEKALSKWRDGNDYWFLSDCLANRLHELLTENGITDKNDTSLPGTKPTQVLYSLGHSQGDGCYFEGNFTWNGYGIRIVHSGRYCHYNSVSMIVLNGEGERMDGHEHKFEPLYKSICDQLESYVYGFIESEDSEESFTEACEANEWTFRKDGEMENAD